MGTHPPAGGDPARRIAQALLAHEGPLVLLAHVDPDGDALGSVLTLARALRRLGREVFAPMAPPPRFLRFLVHDGDLTSAPMARPARALVVVLDGDPRRADGLAPEPGSASEARAADRDGAEPIRAPLVNVDHHASNPGYGIAWVDPSYASATLMVAEVVDTLGVGWDADLATPCLAGLLTDTGHFRFGNTDRRALERAGHLIDAGVAYAELADRLQWRHPDYYRMLAQVMATVRFRLGGEVALVDLTQAMRDAIGDSEDDADDFVGLLRYAEGARVAAILKERGAAVKVSVRSRGGVSARRVCQALGGGGHDAAAGAPLEGATRAEAGGRLLGEVALELAGLP